MQQHWVRYLEKMDRMVEEAFRLNVKWSLQELSKAINGDGKSAPNPLFRVKVCLQGDKVDQQPLVLYLCSFCNFDMLQNLLISFSSRLLYCIGNILYDPKGEFYWSYGSEFGLCCFHD